VRRERDHTMTTRTAPPTVEKKLAAQLRPKLRSRLFLAAVICSFVLPNPRASSAEPIAEAKNQKLAEITAMARHNEKCPDVPTQWAAAYLALLMAAPPTEEQVTTEERKTLALRREIGIVKWCQLYTVEMQQAFLIYQYITRR
jgi:hypothetical protein